MQVVKEIFAHSIRVSLGLLFVLSGYLKLYPIEPFELNFIDLGVANWYTAPIIARALIGFELLLGALLVFDLVMKKFTIKATFFTLIFFTLYLVYQIITTGNQGNCGCFGTVLQMTPLESIFKNIGMLTVLIIVQLIPAEWNFYSEKYLIPADENISEIKPEPRFNQLRKTASRIFVPAFLIIAFVTPYILNLPDALVKEHRIGAVNYPLGISELYADSAKTKPGIDLTRGRHIVAFMSLSCSHCQMTALKMHTLQKRNPDFPFYLILHGDTSRSKKSFFDFSKAENIPHFFYNEDEFFSFVEGSVPKIFWLQNDTVKYHSLYTDMNEDEIKAWVANGIVPSAEDTVLIK